MLSAKWQTEISMEKRLTLRLNEGEWIVLEGAAKWSGKTVSAWVREAIQEHIKGHVQARMMDRIDERIYQLTKDSGEAKKALAKILAILDQVEFE